MQFSAGNAGQTATVDVAATYRRMHHVKERKGKLKVLLEFSARLQKASGPVDIMVFQQERSSSAASKPAVRQLCPNSRQCYIGFIIMLLRVGDACVGDCHLVQY
jgi:hypothetical protein